MGELLRDDAAFYLRAIGCSEDATSALSPAVARAYRSVVESSAPLVCVKDLQLRLLGVNPAYLDFFGFSAAEDVVGRHERDYLRPVGSRDFVDKIIENDLKAIALKKGEVLESEEFLLASDGRLITFFVRRVPVYDEQDQLESIASVMHPLHAHSVSDSAFETVPSNYIDTKMEFLGAFAGGVAHDFNNLLMGILGNSQLGLADTPSELPQWQYFKQIENVTCRAADLCKKMLLYSGKGNYDMKKISLADLVEEVVGRKQLTDPLPVELKLDIDNQIPEILADSEKIRQVINNLLANGFEAVTESGFVSLGVGKVVHSDETVLDLHLTANMEPGEYVFLEVCDTGCGMDSSVLQRLFDPFFSTKFTGRGLGMAEVLGIVHRHNGIVGVKSAPGEGATFKLFFHACEQAAQTESAAAPLGDWRGEGTILLVDDELMVLEVGKLLLQKIGFNVETADDGDVAVEKFMANPDRYCCVLLDLTMPNMDGLTAFQLIRNKRTEIPIIISSGHTEHEVRRRFFSYGISEFIQKPYAFERLVSKLRNLFEGNSAAK